MESRRRWVWLIPAVIVFVGCSGSDQPRSTGQPDSSAPARILGEFLDAVRDGNDAAATALLTAGAQRKLLSGNQPLTPPASDTAQFEIGEVEGISADEAWVNCTWSDLDPYGERQSDEARWRLRREAEGWRVVGVAYRVFEDVPPIELDFENPEDAVRKQRWAEAEARRRRLEHPAQARNGENFDGAIQR
jgi:hypothetical protein